MLLKNIKNYQNREKFLCNVFLNRDLYDIEMFEEDQKETISMTNNDLFNNNNIDIDNIPWIISKYVFENNHEHGYKLHKGDIFKLGKYILRVRELGIDDDKKHFFFENKNTQKYMKDRSFNNISQAPLNQPGENYFSALNLNQIINVQRKEDNNNNNGNSDNNNNNENYNNSHNNNDSNNNENGSVNNENMSHNNENKSIHNSNNIQKVKNESSSSQSNNNIKVIENGNNNLVNNFKPIILINADKDDKKKENNENKNENNIANQDISAYYSNNPSIKNSNNCQSQNYNEIISCQASNSQSNSNKNNNNNSNQFFINIITNNDIENNNNNNLNVLDDSKNKINNNSLNLNSLRFNTFHNNSILNSSMNVSGKNVPNFNNDNEIESSKKNMNIIINNNNNNNNCQIIKSNFTALRSTASFKKKKLTNITQKKISKNSESMTEKNNKPICRICLSEEYEENNPLIHPCNCDGTMKYIHLQCLRLLIQSKIKKTETESCKVFTFKTLECEICKMVFPERIKIKGTVFYIIDLEKPDKNYIILDGLIKETPEEKSIFIVHFKDKKEIKIGRATDANIRLSDISVSRAHAVISQYNDSFYLHDTNSKFGTLISAGNKFCILYNKPFSVQKGNILFEFMMKKTLCATLRCYHPSVVFYRTYNDFLDETFAYKYQTREESMLIPEKTKSVSEYSSHIIHLKPANSRFVSSKMNDIFGENNENENENNNDSELNINKKKNNLSLQSKEDIKNSINNNSPNNSNENNKKSNKNLKNDANNNSQSFFDSFKLDKEKGNNNVNNAVNYSSFGINKTQEISNIYQKNEVMKSNNSRMGITIENHGNENSLLVNNI